MEYRYLSASDLIYVNKRVLEFTGEKQEVIQYPEGLSVIIEQPQMVLFGHELYPSLWLKAAFVLQKSTKKHIFTDGNKRTAYVVTKLFLKLNGYSLKVSKSQGIALMLSVTTSTDSSEIMQKVATFLQQNSVRSNKYIIYGLRSMITEYLKKIVKINL